MFKKVGFLVLMLFITLTTISAEVNFIELALTKFDEINRIPRGSGNEQELSDWLVNYGREREWEVSQDELFNVILRVPGRGELMNKPAVILQGHLDMVNVKADGLEHDFNKDLIQMYIEDGWLKSRGTTLGADNGIGIAIALVVATAEGISHPPLELLFTTNEETDMSGVMGLQPGVLKGKYLINIDSEDDGIITIGCAGGINISIEVPLVFEQNTSRKSSYELSISGLKGGHSGVEIHKNNANAIKIIASILQEITTQTEDFNISSIKAGVAHNVIPTSATVSFSSNNERLINHIIEHMISFIEQNLKESEPNMSISFRTVAQQSRFLTYQNSAAIVDLLIDLPHGVYGMSEHIENLVETSNNLAQITMNEHSLDILLSVRSSESSQLDLLAGNIENIANVAGFKSNKFAGYPSWEPDWDSNLLKIAVQSYKNLYDKDPIIEVIHAGLECGMIIQIYPEIEMISIGPDIQDAHTIDERLRIANIESIINFLLEIFKNI